MSEIFENSPTFRLFKKEPSFSGGMASLFDLSDNLSRYNQDKNEHEADINSLRADWCAVGSDLWKAIKKYERKPETAN